MRALVIVALVVSAAPVWAQGPLEASGIRAAREMALLAAPAAAGDTLDEKVAVGWLRFTEGFYVAGELADALVGWTLVDSPTKEPANPLVPDNKAALVAIKVAAVAGGVALAEQLWKDGHKWQAVAVMAGAGVLSWASAGKTAWEKLRPK